MQPSPCCEEFTATPSCRCAAHPQAIPSSDRATSVAGPRGPIGRRSPKRTNRLQPSMTFHIVLSFVGSPLDGALSLARSIRPSLARSSPSMARFLPSLVDFKRILPPFEVGSDSTNFVRVRRLLPRFDPSRPRFGRIWASLIRFRPTMSPDPAKSGPDSSKFGRVRPNLAQCRPTFGRTTSILARNRPTFGEIDRIWPDFGRTFAEMLNLARVRPNVGEFDRDWPEVGRHLLGFDQCGPGFGGPRSAELGPKSTKC